MSQSLPKILLDADDLLNTFTPALFSMLGATFGPADYDGLLAAVGPSAKTFDLIAQARALFPDRDYTHESFWESITADMWAAIPISEEALFLIEVCERVVGKPNVSVLTAPVRGKIAAVQCAAGKVKWIYEKLPMWLHNQWSISTVKSHVAGECKLLIDDSADNIARWRDPRNGGSGYLWPRPWNSAPSQSLADIKQRIERWADCAYAKSDLLHCA